MWWKKIYLWVASFEKVRLKLRILLITGSFPPQKCGVGDYCHSLAQALSDLPGIHVGVISSQSAGSVSYSRTFEVFPIIKNWGLSEAPKLIRKIKAWNPDIVHVQYPTQGYKKSILPWLIPAIAFLMKRKVVQTWHETYSRRDIIWFTLKGMIPGGLVLVRPTYRQDLHPWLHGGFRGKEVSYIQNASAIPRASINPEDSSQLKLSYLNGQRRLVVFFGFIYPHKGVDLLFDIANPDSDQIVIAGEIDKMDSYHSAVFSRSTELPWNGKVSLVGFLESSSAAELLYVADAVVLPFRLGGGEWNTSIHSACLQGTLVITTSKTASGYQESSNVYYSKVDDIEEMKLALDLYSGRKKRIDNEITTDEWSRVATEHEKLYKRIYSKKASESS